MNSMITTLAAELIDLTAEVGLAAEELRLGTVAVSTATYMQEAKESLQRALDTIRIKIDLQPRQER